MEARRPRGRRPRRRPTIRSARRNASPDEATYVEFRAMRVGIARETAPGERRVAIVPETVGKLTAAGFDVAVGRGAGGAAPSRAEAYPAAGAMLGPPWDAATVPTVRKPEAAVLAS